MKELETILGSINDLIDRYHTLQLNLVKDQSEILRGLTSNLYFLERFRIDAHVKWESMYFQSQGKSGAAKEREADLKTPELYSIRRTMTGAYKVVDALRSTISIYKNES
jgi:hypothetical protein